MEIVFILVESEVPENIGASIRAMNTMGFTDIRLVNPQCDHLCDNAFMLAHGSYDMLRNARVFNSLENALYDCGFTIGTTNKERRQKFNYYLPEEIHGVLKSKVGATSKVALLFGRESKGLIGNEIDLCDILTTIPLKQSHPSLNLSQAVMLYAYSLSSLNFIHDVKEEQFVHEQEYSHLKDKVFPLLQNIGMDPDSKVYNRVKERFAVVGAEDVRLLHSVINLVEKAITNK